MPATRAGIPLSDHERAARGARTAGCGVAHRNRNHATPAGNCAGRRWVSADREVDNRGLPGLSGGCAGRSRSGLFRERLGPAEASHQRQPRLVPRFRWRFCRSGTPRGDPTLDSLGPSLSQVLGTTPRPVVARSDRSVGPAASGAADSRIAASSSPHTGGTCSVSRILRAHATCSGASITRFGNAIRLDATLQDLDRGEAVPLNAMAANEGSLLAAISELAEAVRQNLSRGSPACSPSSRRRPGNRPPVRSRRSDFTTRVSS